MNINTDEIKMMEKELIKWKQAFKKHATHSVGCMIKHEHNGDTCSCGYSELRKEILNNEYWINWVLAKRPY